MAPTTRQTAVKHNVVAVGPRPAARSVSNSSWGSTLTSLTDSSAGVAGSSTSKRKDEYDSDDDGQSESSEEDQLDDQEEQGRGDMLSKEMEMVKTKRGRPAKTNASMKGVTSGAGAASTSGQHQQKSATKGRSRNAIAQAKHRAKRKAYITQLEETVRSLEAAFQSRRMRDPAFARMFQSHSSECSPPESAADAIVEQRLKELELENKELLRMCRELRQVVDQAEVNARTQARATHTTKWDHSDGMKKKKNEHAVSLPRIELDRHEQVGSGIKLSDDPSGYGEMGMSLHLPSDARFDVGREQKRRRVSLVDEPNEHMSPGDELVLCSPHHANYGSDSFGSTSTIMNTSFPHGFHRSASSRSPVAYAPSAEASYKISRHESDRPNDSNAFLLPQLPPLSLPSPSFPTQEQMQTQTHAFEHSRSATPLHLPIRPNNTLSDEAQRSFNQPPFHGLSLTPYSKSGDGSEWDESGPMQQQLHLQRRASGLPSAMAEAMLPPDTIPPFSRPSSSLSVHSVSTPFPGERSPSVVQSFSHPSSTSEFMPHLAIHEPSALQTSEWNAPVKSEPTD